MEILTEIPFSLDANQIMTQSRVEAGSDYADDLLALVELARKVGRPKAAYAVCFIGERDGDTIQIDDTWFTSRTLVRNLMLWRATFCRGVSAKLFRAESGVADTIGRGE